MGTETKEKAGVVSSLDGLVQFSVRWLFKLTPAKWICVGCNTQRNGLRFRWGRKITEIYGSV